jgi:glycosyltransferase involved in cell wall biosynthesis
MKPLVTIAVPSYNQGRFLNQALASIFEQELPMEVFLMDGGSTDGSVDVIKRWESRLSGWRSHPDRGQAAAINEGIALGSAPYVCWLNSDDYFLHGGLSALYRTLENHPQSPFVYGRCWTVSETGKRIIPYLTLDFSPRIFANFCFIAQPGTLIRRSAWQGLGGLNEAMQMAFDYDLWWRLYTAFGKPDYRRNFVASTRMHSKTKTATHKALHYRESIDTIERNWGSIPFKWRALMPFARLFDTHES